MRFLATVFMLLLLTGCQSSTDERHDPPQVKPPTAAETQKESEAERLAKLKKDAADEDNKLKKVELELQVLRLEKSIAEREAREATAAIKDKKDEITAIKLDAAQNKLYVGAGALVLIAIVLTGLAFYFKSAHIAYWAVGTGGVACLVATAGFLAPYVYWIAGFGTLAFIGFLCWLLFGRDKALFQLTKGMNDIKAYVPQYKNILREHIDTAQDVIIDDTRKRWGDPQV